MRCPGGGRGSNSLASTTVSPSSVGWRKRREAGAWGYFFPSSAPSYPFSSVPWYLHFVTSLHLRSLVRENLIADNKHPPQAEGAGEPFQAHIARHLPQQRSPLPGKPFQEELSKPPLTVGIAAVFMWSCASQLIFLLFWLLHLSPLNSWFLQNPKNQLTQSSLLQNAH
jgi:hypothetical protein